MQLTVIDSTPSALRAGYDCPCGCQPSLTYQAHGETAYDACCCGNEFALGHAGTAELDPRESFRREATAFSSAWGEPMEAVWLIGASRHPAAEPDHGHQRDHAPESQAESPHRDGNGHEHVRRPLAVASARAADRARGETALDPVCGMTVDPEAARAAGRYSQYKGVDYFFCSRGCKLDFDEEPERYLDPSYTPSM